MSTFEIISIISNIALGLTVLLLVLPKAKAYYMKEKKRRENQKNLKKANFTKTIRTEVRRYLEELQNNEQ